ncbi:Hypothetical protein A7982_03757 [Minicystis rosea]|nr:Hypothetical protein A7982_03757 [Minicystis rosea]
MTQPELQRDVRSAISITYELLRHEHVLEREWIARTLGDLEDELARIEAKLGGPRRGEIVPSSLDPWMERVEQVAHDADPVVAGQIRALLASLRDIQAKLVDTLAGRGGLRAAERRAAVDCAVGAGAIASIAIARTTRAKLAGAALGASALSLAAVGGNRRDRILGTRKHISACGALGAALVAAPFVLGYAHKDPNAATAQALTGLLALGGALVTALRHARA